MKRVGAEKTEQKIKLRNYIALWLVHGLTEKIIYIKEIWKKYENWKWIQQEIKYWQWI